MNNRIYGTVSISALMTASVVSAGSPEPMVTIIPPVVASVATSDFDGFYVGAAVTSFSGESTTQFAFADGSPFTSLSLDDYSGTGGAIYAGYNFASAVGFFYGGELSYGMPNASAPYVDTADVDSILSVKGRFGYVSGPLMYYGTAGYAMAELSCGGCEAAFIDGTAQGFLVGAGIEYMFSNNISVRGEYILYDLTGAESAFFVNDSDYVSSTDLTANVISVGLSYNF